MSSSPQSPCSTGVGCCTGGEAESELFTQGETSRGLFVTSSHALHSGPPPDFLAFDFRSSHYIILKVGVQPSILSSNAVFHSASLQPCRYYWLFLFPIPHSFNWRFSLSGGSVNNVSLVLFFHFFVIFRCIAPWAFRGLGLDSIWFEWLLLEHWNVSSSWALHGDGHRHSRTAWEVESILGVFWSSPFIFSSFLTCLLDIRGALCTSAFQPFFFLYFLLSPLDWLVSLHGETKDAAFYHVCYHCGSISACTWHTQERAFLKSYFSFIILIPLLSSPRGWWHCGFDHSNGNYFNWDFCFCRSV